VSLRHRVHQLLEADTAPSRAARTLRLWLGALILVNVCALVAETVPGARDATPWLFDWIERCSIVVFLTEYALRLWSVPEDPRYAHPILGRLRWMATPMAIVDLVSVLPTLLSASAFDLRSMRLIRLMRILRIVKVGRYSLAAQTLTNVLRSKAADLLSLLFLLVMMLLISSTVMFFFENEAQPQVFSSIPATMWWGIVTLTTIGYGDMTPVTLPGRMLGAVIAIVGIGMFALPAGLLGAAFVDELGKARARAGARTEPGAPCGGACPHCGKPLP
jgi:voltage-gated potassium channel